MQNTLIQQGLDLMIFGMGTVFIFLTLLVISVTFMSKIISRFFAELEEEQTPTPSSAVPVRGAKAVDPRVLVAIQEAIHQHRAKQP